MRTNDKHQTTHFDSKIRAFEIQEYKIQSWSITFNRNRATCFSTLPTNSPGQRFLPSNNIKRAKKGWKKGEDEEEARVEEKGRENKRGNNLSHYPYRGKLHRFLRGIKC